MLVDDVCQNELAAVMRSPRLKMDVHITSEIDRKDSGSFTEDYTISHGRPDVYETMRSAREVFERERPRACDMWNPSDG